MRENSYHRWFPLDAQDRRATVKPSNSRRQAVTIGSAWTRSWSVPGFSKLLLLTVVSLGGVLWAYPRFLTVNEARPGFAFVDPYLAWFVPQDLTWLTFGVLYAALLVSIAVLIRYPGHLVLALQTYTLMALFRMAAMYGLPLAPPAATIPLVDPFVQMFSGEVLLQDLFFSGHTATLFVLFLTAPTRRLRGWLLGATVVVAAAVLVQHVHYFVDVIAAPFFVYGCYALAKLFNHRVFGLTLGQTVEAGIT